MHLKTFTSPALKHLRLELVWLRRLLEVRLRQMQGWGLLPPADDLRPGSVIYPQEVEARLRASWGVLEDEADEADEWVMLAQQRLEEALEARQVEEEGGGFAADAQSKPLKFVRERFGLSEAEYVLLLLAVAPAFDPSFPRIYAYLQNHFERQYPTLALLVDALVNPSEGDCMRRLLEVDGALIKYQLIQIFGGRIGGLAPMYQPLVAEGRLLRFLEGDSRLDVGLAGFSALMEVDQAEDTLLLWGEEQTRWERLLRVLEGAGWKQGWLWPLVVLRGPKGVGRHRRAREIAKNAGFNKILSVDAEGLKAAWRGDLYGGLRVVMREAVLQDALPCLWGWEAMVQPLRLGGGGEEPGSIVDNVQGRVGLERVLEGVLGQYARPLLLLVEGKDVPLPEVRERVTEVLDLGIPPNAVRTQFWERILGPGERGDIDIERLSAMFHMTPGQIQAAVETSRRALDGTQEGLTQKRLITTIKEQISHRLGDQARLVEKKYQWSDLIVSPDVGVQIRELISRYRYRTRVLEQWGLGRRFGQDLGLSTLFEGPPGTGKTMAASIIAGELGLDLYQIDLSRVVSRYVGETEKNLGKIFDEAERAQAMLLFDEADSLFGSRTEVKSSNDRYANLEVNYLLQRIEHFTGVAILTTNFPAGIDDAFTRRLSMRVSFNKPGPDERKRLWRSMLSSSQLPKGDIDFAELAGEFELAGGHIRNAILRAAFIAASRDRLIDHDLLFLAARIEMKEQGMLVHGNPMHELSDEITKV